MGKRLVVVLGMDRSGTSLCTNILNRLGVELNADLLPPQDDNPLGFFESRQIMELHNELLEALGTNWHMPTTLKPLPAAWWRLPLVRPFRERIVALLRAELRPGAGLWGFKDPRICRLLPLWKDVFAELEIAPVYVLAVRRPQAVAQSLQRRNGFLPPLSELLWLERNLEALAYAGDRIAAIVHYEDWFTRPEETARDLIDALSLPWQGDGFDLEDLLRQTVMPEHRHDTKSDEAVVFPFTATLYRGLREGAGADLAGLVRTGREVLRMCRDIALFQQEQLQAPLATLRAEAAGYIARIAELDHVVTLRDQHCAALTGEVTARDEAIARLGQERGALGGRIAELERLAAMREQQSAMLGAEVAARDDAILRLRGEQAALTARLSEMNAALAGRERQIAAQAGEIAARDDAIARLREETAVLSAQVAALTEAAAAAEAEAGAAAAKSPAKAKAAPAEDGPSDAVTAQPAAAPAKRRKKSTGVP